MLDQIDLKILSILQNQGRTHLADIAKEVDLSSPAVMERVKKLETQGVIKGYQAVLDPKKMGKDVAAFVGVSVSHQKYIDGFASYVTRQHDVLECHHVTGEESFILKVKTANTDSLEKLLAEIRSVEGVTGTITKVVLSSVKESQKLEFNNGTPKNSRKKVAKAG
ncbi:MAG TPA: Lrp/AsnC family transcriptional regulator [Candidatus Binatia bacterium]